MFSFFSLALTCASQAVTVGWTDWSSNTANSASGQMDFGNGPITVTATSTSNWHFVQTGTGTNYMTGPAYTNGSIDNPPPASELIALNGGGTVTVGFSETVTDPFIALVSWNGNNVEFGDPIEIESSGSGFWGSGAAILNVAETGFFGSGELHGVVKVIGDYDSITFTHQSENWHGFTVGAFAEAPEPITGIPEPSNVILLGFLLAGGMLRRQRS